MVPGIPQRRDALELFYRLTLRPIAAICVDVCYAAITVPRLLAADKPQPHSWRVANGVLGPLFRALVVAVSSVRLPDHNAGRL